MAAQLDLVGLAEVAEILGLTRSTIAGYRARPPRWDEQRAPFPVPVAELRCGPIWTRRQMLDFKRKDDALTSLSRGEFMRSAQARRMRLRGRE